MQMGSSGYGLTHGYDGDEDKDDDNSHEYKGHGVSRAWIHSKVISAKVSSERGTQFKEKMMAKADSAAAKKKYPMARKYEQAAGSSHTRQWQKGGWDRKKTHGLTHEDD